MLHPKETLADLSEDILFLPNPWWLHVGGAFKSSMLVCGEIDKYSVILLSKISGILYLYGCDTSNYVEELSSNIIEVSREDLFNNEYEGIVINQLELRSPFNNKELSSLASSCLSGRAVICLLELGEGINSIIRNPFNVLLNLFYNRRKHELKALLRSWYITHYQTISYNDWPYESFLPFGYYTNKNIFRFKEKIKHVLFNSFLSRALTNSSIWILSKNAECDSLMSNLTNHITHNIKLKWKGANIRVLKLYYKPGKFIISLTSRDDNRSEYVAVVTLDRSSLQQRENEKRTVQYLRQNINVSPYICEEYEATDFGRFRLFIMSEMSGMTVDINNNNIQLMTENSYSVLDMITSQYVQIKSKNTLSKLIFNYLEIFKLRSPDCLREISIIELFFSKIDFSLFPLVFVHGDLKLENFILNSKNEVVGLIDFELAEIKGFALIDLMYLIIYNHQIQNNGNFHSAYNNFASGALRDYEKNMVTDYLQKYSISDYQKQVLIVVFFVHHYSQRFRVDAGPTNGKKEFEASMQTALNIIKSMTIIR